MQFLDLIESLPANEASGSRIYSGDGRRVRDFRTTDPTYMRSLDEALRLIEAVHTGDRYAALKFVEAMGTDDFPQLFGDVIDRAMLGAYNEYPSGIESYVRMRSVRDFRTVKRFALDGAEGVLDVVDEQGPYPEASLSDTEYSYAVQKRGRKLALSWESLVNDDLDAFRDLPMRLGRAARRSELKFVTELFVDSSGPHASLYAAGNSNIVTSNPALSVAGLTTAWTVLGNQTDEDGEPISVEAATLVVPPALEVTARNIVNAIHIDAVSSGGGTSAQNIRAQNWLGGRITVSVNPYIPIVASSSNGNTSWFLFADPAVGRPALELGKLRGHEAPEIWVKDPNARRVGGGTVGPDQGDFDTDSVQHRVRHVFGGTRLDPKATVGSEGDGS